LTTLNPKVDGYIRRSEKWHEELEALRQIVHGFPFVEELKWGKPAYSYEGNNTVILTAFKDYCVIMFFKGSLLADPKGILVAPGENSQAARQIRVTSVEQVKELESVIKAYIDEAIEVEKAGLKVQFKDPAEVTLVEELQTILDGDPALKAAFEALTPGRRRAYNLFFSGAKQSATRTARVEKWIPQILEGKGMND